MGVASHSDLQPVRRFGACMADLEAIADWLQQCGVTIVVMESSGVSWIPLCALLAARGFAVMLTDEEKRGWHIRLLLCSHPWLLACSSSTLQSPCSLFLTGYDAPHAKATRKSTHAGGSITDHSGGR
jgi:hypothetical protein